MIVANDNDGRFTVAQGHRRMPCTRSYNHKSSKWYVYDGDAQFPMTIGFPTEAEAMRRLDRIAVLYERYGW